MREERERRERERERGLKAKNEKAKLLNQYQQRFQSHSYVLYNTILVAVR